VRGIFAALLVSHYTFMKFVAKEYNNIFEFVKLMSIVLSVPCFPGHGAWCGYPLEKKFEDMFIRFDRIHERDGQTDGQTHRPRMTAGAVAEIKVRGRSFFLLK